MVPEGIAERLEAAAGVFADQGFDQTRIEDLAEATGIPRAGRIPDIAAAIQAAFHHPVRRLLAEGEADGTLRPVGDPETTASAVYGAVTTAAAHYLVADNRLDTDRVATEVTTILLTGLGPTLRTGSARGNEARSAPPGRERPDRRPARGRR